MKRKNITFVTTNAGKVESLRKKLNKEVILHQISLSLPELQNDTGSEVVLWKAKEAYKIIKKPLLVQDSSFHLNTFNGFPGSYIKYVIKTIGIKGILEMMKKKSDRTCYFEDAIGYTEDGKNVKVFVSFNRGKLSKNIDKANKKIMWSDLWKIFIPDGSKHTLSSATIYEIEHAKDLSNPGPSCFTQFVEYINNKNKIYIK